MYTYVMKKIRFLFLLIILFISPVFADNYLNMGEFLQTYFNTIIQDNQIPTSYKYIQLKYPNISR
ncbi:TPA: hypothetical protein DEP21_03250 [Patescibacteria group bacterium]|nr:hypothetical protein [Candidatus Gracilibacteria bacterium]